MKKIVVAIALTAFLCGLAACATAPAPKAGASAGGGQKIPSAPLVNKGPKKRVAVIAFENKSGYGRARIGQTATDILITELVKSDQFIVVERDKLGVILGEQKLEQGSFMDTATAARTGRLLGVNAIVTGAVTNFGVNTEGTDVMGYKKKEQTAECTVDIRVVDAETGRILYADSGKGVKTYEATSFNGMGQKANYNETIEGDALRAAVSTFLNNVMTQISYLEWAGKIAKVAGNMVYVNAGHKTGLTVGTVLQVRALGDEIRDPDTGLSMGRTPGQFRGDLQVADYFGEDGSVCMVLNGAGFDVGDEVKIKKN